MLVGASPNQPGGRNQRGPGLTCYDKEPLFANAGCRVRLVSLDMSDIALRSCSYRMRRRGGNSSTTRAPVHQEAQNSRAAPVSRCGENSDAMIARLTSCAIPFGAGRSETSSRQDIAHVTSSADCAARGYRGRACRGPRYVRDCITKGIALRE